MTNPRFPIRRSRRRLLSFSVDYVYPVLLSWVPEEEGYPWHEMLVGRSMALLCYVTAVDLQGTLSWLLPSYSLSQLRLYKKWSFFRDPSAPPMQDWARPNSDALSHRLLNMNMSHVDADLRELFELHSSRILQLRHNCLARLFKLVEVSPDTTSREELELVWDEEWPYNVSRSHLPLSIKSGHDFYSLITDGTRPPLPRKNAYAYLRKSRHCLKNMLPDFQMPSRLPFQRTSNNSALLQIRWKGQG